MKQLIWVAILALSVAGCSGSPNADSAGTVTPENLKPAPDFELSSLSGGSLKSSDIKGKVAIVDFWATWCSPCIKEIPNYNELYSKHDGKGVQMLGITVESGTAEDVKPHVTELEIKYPVVMGDDKVVEGFGGLIGFPTTYVVTKDWKIYKRYLGMTPNKREQLEKDIETLLAQ